MPKKDYLVVRNGKSQSYTSDEFNDPEMQSWLGSTEGVEAYELTDYKKKDQTLDGDSFQVYTPDGSYQSYSREEFEDPEMQSWLKTKPNYRVRRVRPTGPSIDRNAASQRLSGIYDRINEIDTELGSLPQQADIQVASDPRAIQGRSVAAMQQAEQARRNSPDSVRSRELRKEREELIKERSNNPMWKQYWQAMGEGIGESAAGVERMQSELDKANPKSAGIYNGLRLSDREGLEAGTLAADSKANPEYYRDKAALDSANYFYREAKKVASAPSKYGDEKGTENFWRGIMDEGFSAISVVGAAESMNNIPLIKAVKKIQDNLGAETDIRELMRKPENVEFLSDAEKEMLKAFLIRAEVESGRSEDLSKGYQAGKSFAQSLGFMTDFMLMGGLGDAAAGKVVGKVVERAAENAVAKGVSKTLGTIGADALHGLVKAVAMSPMMPSTYSNILNTITQLNENGNIDLSTHAIRTAIEDSLIENVSETIGAKPLELFGFGMSKALPKDWLTKVGFGTWAKAMTNSGFASVMKKAGYHGFIEEMFEEVTGNALRAIPVVGTDPDALKDFFKGENLLITAASFAPMAAVGLPMSTMQYAHTSNMLSASEENIKRYLTEQGVDQKTIDGIISKAREFETPEKLGDYMSNVFLDLVESGKDPAKAYELVNDYTTNLSTFKVITDMYEGEKDIERTDRILKIDAQLGKENWKHSDEKGNAFVRTLTSEDGKTYYVVGEGEGEIVTMDESGTPFYVKQESLGQYTDSGEMPLNRYLDDFNDAEKNAEEAQQMRWEAQTARDRFDQNVSEKKPVEMGTSEAPVVGELLTTIDPNTGVEVPVRQPEGSYIVLTPDGTQHLVSEENLASKWGIQLQPKTQDQKDADRIAEREAAHKRKMVYNRIPIGSEVEATLEGIEEPVKYNFVRAKYNEAEDGLDIVVTDLETGEEVTLPEEAFPDLSMAATEVSETIAPTEEMPVDDTPRDSKGRPLPMRTAADGTQRVDEQKLWNERPEEWVLYNDSKPNRIVDSKSKVESAIKTISAQNEEAKSMLQQEMMGAMDQDKIDEYEKVISDNNGLLSRYDEILKDIESRENAEKEAAKAAEEAAKEEVKAQEAEAPAEAKETLSPEQEQALAEEERRVPLRARAREWVSKTGVDVALLESVDEVENQEARNAISKGEPVKGWFDKSTGKVYLYMPGLEDEADVDKTYIHEVISHKGLQDMLGAFYPSLLDSVWRDVMSDADRKRFTNYIKKTNPSASGDALRRAAADEYIADLSEHLDVEENKTAWEKFVMAVRSFLIKMVTGGIRVTNEDLSELLQASMARYRDIVMNGEATPLMRRKARSEMMKFAENGGASTAFRTEDMIEEIDAKAQILRDGISSIDQAAQLDDTGIRFSIRTEAGVQRKIREFAKSKEGKELGWTEEKIESIISETADLMRAINAAVSGDKYYDEWAKKDPTVTVDWRDGQEKPIVTWSRNNIEYKYDMSADLLCINNEALETVLASPTMVDLMMAMNRATPEGFTSADYLRLYETLRDMGFVVPCKGCFDAAMRLKMLPSVAKNFVELVNKTIDERNKDPEAFDKSLRDSAGKNATVEGLPTTAKSKEDAVRVGVAGDNLTEHISWAQLMSAEGQTQALTDWGGIFRAWQRTGAGRPKDKLLPEPWSGDIVSTTTTIIGKYGEKTPSYRSINVNQGTGLRRNSHSEFRPILAIDEIQFMREAFIRNLTVFKYMKELDDVRLFGHLGVKFNMSFFPEFVEGAPAAGLDANGDYIAAEESVGGREFAYKGEDGKVHYDGMKGLQEAEKYVNKDVSLSSVIFSVPHLIKALTDVPTPSDKRGRWGSLIPFHASGATKEQLKKQGLGDARAVGPGHGFDEAMSDWGNGVTNFEAVQNDRFGEGWTIVEGKKAGTAVEPGHKLEFVNGTHYYNEGMGLHLFPAFYIYEDELTPEDLDENGKVIASKAKAHGHLLAIDQNLDYNDKVREIGTDTAYKEAADFYIQTLKDLGLIPRFDFDVPEDVFLKACADAKVDPTHPKLGWRGPGYSWSPADSEAYYSLWCDYGMTDPSTGKWAPHNPVGMIDENGERVFKMPENTVEIVKKGVERYSERRGREEAKTMAAIEEFAKRSIAEGKISQKEADAILSGAEETAPEQKQQKTGEQMLNDILASLSKKAEAEEYDETAPMRFKKGDPSTQIGNTFFRISDGSLVGLHNISEEKLKKAQKAGGLANPSAAVIDISKQEHNNFGEISLVMPSSMVAATSGKNNGTYLGDAWTPTFPGTQKKMSKVGQKAFDKQIMALPSDVRYNVENAFENYLERDNDGNALRWWFLNETGRNPAIIHHESPYSEEDAKVIENLNEWELKDEDIRTLGDIYRKYASEEDVRKATTKFEPRENAAEFVRKRMREYNDEIDKYGITVAPLEGFLRQAKDQIRRDGRLDDYRTMDSARQFIEDNNLGEEFRSWLEGKEDEFGVETKLFAGWDRNGYKKWIDYTAENASKLMNKESGRNAYSDNGLSATHALLVKKMRTLGEIKKNKDLLVSRAEYDERYDQVDKELHDAISTLDNMQKISDNPFTNYDYTASRLQEALTRENPAAYLNSEYKYSIPEDGEYAQQLQGLKRDIMEMPVNYFETKFNRPVGLNEFTSAVVPSSLDEKTRKILEDAGVKMFEYDPKQEGSRRDATMKATEQEGIRFRIAPNEADDAIRFRVREGEPPVKTQKVYKLMRRGENPDEVNALYIDSATPLKLGTWYDADAPSVKDLEKLDPGYAYKIDANGNVVDKKEVNRTQKGSITRLPSVDDVNAATAEDSRWITVTIDKKGNRSYHNVGINGSGETATYAMRPGWHAGTLPTMRQIGKGKNKDIRDDEFVWVEGEVAADNDYQAEADSNPNKDIPDHIPTDGYYLKATNADKVKSQADRVGWYVAGSFKPNRIIGDLEARSIIDKWNEDHPDAKVDYDYEREGGRIFNADTMQLEEPKKELTEAQKKAIEFVTGKPAAKESEDNGIRFSIRGIEGVKNAEDAVALANLDTAEEMEEAGKDSRTIWLATGWERGADGKWRNEIPDAKAKDVNLSDKNRAGDILDAPELFKSYPQIEDMPINVIKLPEDIGGVYRRETRSIDLNKDYGTDIVEHHRARKLNKDGLRTLIHELQHAIQHIEGFARGGSSSGLEHEHYEEVKKTNGPLSTFAWTLSRRQSMARLLRAGREQVIRQGEALDKSRFTDGEKKEFNNMIDYLKGISDADYTRLVKDGYRVASEAKALGEKYSRLAGEVEARNVQKRNSMGAEERKNKPLESTEDVWREDQILRFRVANANQKIFISNAEAALDKIKMERATPEQWVKMLEKEGGMKAAEDKWLGLSDWLNSLDRKTVEKAEIAEYIKDNQIIIEEQRYAEEAEDAYGKALESYQDEFDAIRNEMEEEDSKLAVPRDSYLIAEDAFREMVERYGDDFGMAFDYEAGGNGYTLVPSEDYDGELSDAAKYFLDQRRENTDVKPISTTRKHYTTEGLTNLQEIALTVPTIDPWNEDDKIHFGDAGEGRAISWIRFGDTWTSAAKDEAEKKYREADKAFRDYRQEVINKYALQATDTKKTKDLATEEENKKVKDLQMEAARLYQEWQYGQHQREKVLVIDEIQSKRHQEAREQGGYKDDTLLKKAEARRDEAKKAYDDYTSSLIEKYGSFNDMRDKITPEENAESSRLYMEFRRFENAVARNGFDPMNDEEYRGIKEEMDKVDNDPEFARLREEWIRAQDALPGLLGTEKEADAVKRFEDAKEGLRPFQDRAWGLQEKLSAREKELADAFNKNVSTVPAAPFERTWPELSMKRMLRYAAEYGYDTIAWTTGEQQADRYNMESAIGKLYASKDGEKYYVEVYDPEGKEITFNGLVGDSRATGTYTKEELVKNFKKEAAKEIISAVDALPSEGEVKKLREKAEASGEKEDRDALRDATQATIDGSRLFKGEGMKTFYDEMIPNFMNKYGKKWGVKVEDIYLPALGEDAAAGAQKGLTMHSVKVTPEMKESVMNGQLMFRMAQEEKRDDSKELFEAAKERFGTTKDLREAGYVLPDGSMLDFSGRHQASGDTSYLNGERTVDHRDIEDLNFERDLNTPSGRNTNMEDFISRGAIRIHMPGMINLAMKPTPQQESVLERLINADNHFVRVEFGDGYNSETYADYDDAKPVRVLNEIKRYFDEGVLPAGNVRFRITPEQDKEYMDAVEKGDMEKAQQMVRDAFKEAYPDSKIVDEDGNPLVLYHGTKRMFWTFDGGKSRGLYDDGLNFFALDREFADDWASHDDDKRRGPEENERIENAEEKFREYKRGIVAGIKEKYGNDVSYPETTEWQEAANGFEQWERENLGLDGLTLREARRELGKRILPVYINSSNPYNPTELYDSVGKQMLIDLGQLEAEPSPMSEMYARGGAYIYYEKKEVIDELKRRGYDSIYLSENVWSDPSKNLRTLAVWDANRIKSADPVTYDDNGNVIPLSERFNPGNEDIRFKIAYHAGDLGKAENNERMNSGHRSTGHFGTGTYFVGDESKINGEGYKDRPHHKVEFDGYNLYRPGSFERGLEVHDLLKRINYEIADYPSNWPQSVKEYDANVNELRNQMFSEEPDIEKVREIATPVLGEKYVNEQLEDTEYGLYRIYDRYAKDRDYYGRTVRDHVRAGTDYDHLAFVLALDLHRYEDDVKKAIAKAKESGYKDPNGDTPSTVFMKALGYDGVDVRGIDGLDNTTYGSVIYDVKPESVVDAGYDGVIAESGFDEMTVVFKPTQIKSATKNSGEFGKENPSIFFRITPEMDAEYEEAYKSGDTAKASRMVEEAAKAAGYTQKAYRVQNNKRLEEDGINPNEFKNVFGGVFYAESLDYFDHTETSHKKQDAKPYFINTQDFWDPMPELDLEKWNWHDMRGKMVDFEKYGIADEADFELPEEWGVTSTDGLAVAGQKLGFKGTILRDIPQEGTANDYTEYAVYDSDSVKSGAPFTFDDEGKLIPLSKRFDTKSSDTRFKLGEPVVIPGPTAEELITKVQNSGLPGILDKELVDDYFRSAFTLMPESDRKAAAQDAIDNDLNFRRPVRDYIASLAAKGYANDETGFLRAMANRLEQLISTDQPISENQLLYMMWRDAKRYPKQDVLSLAQDISLRKKLGVGEFSGRFPASSEAINSEAETAVEEANKERNEVRKEAKDEAKAFPYAAINRAMGAQRQYDRATVDAVVDMAKKLIRENKVTGFNAREMSRIMTYIKSTNGKRPETVKTYCKQLMDLMVNHAVQVEKDELNRLLKVKTDKVKAPRVNTIAKLDIRAQGIIKAFKSYFGLDEATIQNAIASRRGKMESDTTSETRKEELDAEITGMTLALQYAKEIASKDNSDREIRALIDDEKAKYNELSPEEQKNQRKLHDEKIDEYYGMLRKNNIDRVTAYRELNAALSDEISEGKDRALTFLESERQRINEIHHAANADLQGIPAIAASKKEKRGPVKSLGVIGQVIASPMANAEQLLRLLGRKSVDGRGYLYNMFVPKIMKAADDQKLGEDAAYDKLNKKVQEIFNDPDMTFREFYLQTKRLPKVKYTYTDASGEEVTSEVGQGQLLYIYMVDKMPDGRMKLRNMGISEDDVRAIRDNLDPKLIEFADWVQEDFLEGLRDKYNEVHKRMFGTSMAAIDNYFPLKIAGGARRENVDLSEADAATLASTLTGAIINRTVNTTQIDLENADAFEVLADHIDQMEDWAAYAEVRRDLNTLLSYTNFKNKVRQMKTIFGTDTDLWKTVINTMALAVGKYSGKGNKGPKVDTGVLNFSKAVSAAKINFRVYTALKQMLSYPAYFADTNAIELAKATLNMANSWKWAMQNLPVLKKRWESGTIGNEKLEKSDYDWNFWDGKVGQFILKDGMLPNRFVDMLTVSIGAKAVYETMKKRYMKEGYSEERAEKKAKLDAEVAPNATQQSSVGLFLSTIQKDKTIGSNLVSLFRNASMGYLRQVSQAIRSYGRMMKPGYKNEYIEFTTKQLVRDGLTEENAAKAAKSRYNRAKTNNAVRIAVFGWMLPFLWNLGSHMVYLLLGDDDDKKKEMLTDDLVKATLGGVVEGLAGGNAMSEVMFDFARGNGTYGKNYLELPIEADTWQLISQLRTDPVRAANDLVNLAFQMGIASNPQVLTDTVLAIVDACRGDFETAEEAMFCILRIMQVPQSQLDELMIDEIGMTAKDAHELSYEEIAQRYAEYKSKRNAFATDWMYSEEGREKVNKKNMQAFKKKYNKRMKLKEQE